ncbi:zinc knuckle CX2CX4HX4C containing protein [Tanacetum coccineum]
MESNVGEDHDRGSAAQSNILRGVAASMSKHGSKIASVFSKGQFTPPKHAFRSLRVDELAELEDYDPTSPTVGNVNAFIASSSEITGMKTNPLGEFTINTTMATGMENIGEVNMIDGITSEFIDINTKSTSYAGAAGVSAKDQPKVNCNFRPLVADPVFDGVNISIPRKVVEKVSIRFEHTLYGYFIGKRMAFPVVEYYARNNWAKHGLKMIMMNAKGFFFFKFDTRAGLEAVLEGGPWMICNSPIILEKWSMDTSWLKEELTRISIWVKLHDVPLYVFEEDGISLIATLIEADLVDVATIGIPSLTGDGSTKETIRVEYEWRPPTCDTCKIFGHIVDGCLKKVVATPRVNLTNDGVQQLKRYEPKAATSVPMKVVSNMSSTSKSPFMSKNQPPKVTVPSSKEDNITMSNSYKALDEESEEDVENVYDESANLLHSTQTGGSSSTFTVPDG